MSWTDERVEKLTSLWNDGMSASQIAKELGGVTRNAVIGKVHRLGLASRTAGKGETSAAVSPAPSPAPAKPKPRATAEASAPKPQPTAPVEEKKAVTNTPVVADEQPPFELPSENAVDIAAIDMTARKLPLMELTERTCKWPIGDPSRGDEFYFCGQPAAAGKPYCEGHSSAAYQPMSSRRDRERMRNQNRPAIGR